MLKTNFSVSERWALDLLRLIEHRFGLKLIQMSAAVISTNKKLPLYKYARIRAYIDGYQDARANY